MDRLRQNTSSNARRTAVASLIGTTIEWYDFYIYGTAAALVFNTLFFPSYDPTVGTLLSFATFALGALMRPLGGLVCGHFGDRVGRKSMLIFTLVAMGAVTFLIGLLPTYEQVGVWAAVLLIALRMLQGFAFGGEWGGAVLMAVEHAPENRRGFYGCFPQMGSPIALFLSTGTFSLLALLPDGDFRSWGWRVPFLLSAILVIVGLVLRLRLFESPEFVDVIEKKEVARRPVVEVFRKDALMILIGTGAVLSTVVAFYVQTLFVVSYGTDVIGFDRQTVLNAVLFASALELVLLPAFAVLSDRIGRRAIALLGAALTALTSFPFFWLVNTGTWIGVTAAICLAMIGISALYAVVPAYVSDLFTARVRYSGISASYTIASGIIGGFSPLIAGALYLWAKSFWPVALYLAVVGAISFVAIYAGRRRGAASPVHFESVTAGGDRP